MKTKKVSLTAVVSLCSVLLVNNIACAGIQVSPMTVTINPESQYVGEINVFSDVKERQYIDVQVRKIENPATPEQQEKTFSARENAGDIIISPSRFILLPGGHRLIRILSDGPPAREEAWRVYVRPVSAKEFGESTENRAANVTVNIDWGVLVHNEPQNPQTGFRYEPVKGALTNTGNVRAFITRYGFCQSVTGCKWMTFGHAIYPGMSWILNKKKEGITEGNKLIVEYLQGDNTARYKDIAF